MDRNIDEIFMEEAIKLALEAAERDEVPVGAVCVRDGKIISMASNTREESKCATHHAEILAIEAACTALGGWRLPMRYRSGTARHPQRLYTVRLHGVFCSVCAAYHHLIA